MVDQERLAKALADLYRIEREIGRGGMATVFLARDLKRDRRVAVKVLDPDLAQSLGTERFLREIKTAANLRHPHILPVYDSGKADGFLFYVMPYAQGETLRERLTREKQLPLEDAVRIAREIADALAYAHGEGVIHRDVKPANIMLESGHAVLADFGVCHALAEASDERLTSAGIAVGTPAYMSPEQVGGGLKLDGRSDQYSLGCVLYEMLAGDPPFSGATPSAVLARQVQGRLPSLSVVRPNVPTGLVRVVERSLAKVPADRHHDSLEFLHALERGTTGEVQVAPRKTSLRVGALLGMVTLLLATAGTVYLILPRGNTDSVLGEGLPRIAITFFDDHSSNGDLAFLADDLTEHVSSFLAQINAIHVIPMDAMKPFKETGLTPERIVELGPDAWVEGAVLGTPDSVCVSVKLIDANDLHYLESEVVRGIPGQETDAVLSGLTEEVSVLLRSWLGDWVETEELKAGTQSEVAWDLFLQGKARFSEATVLRNEGDTAAAERRFADADEILERAESEDRSFLAPIVERGWVLAERARSATTQARYNSDWALVGMGHAERALAKDRDQARALELRGVLLYYLGSVTAEGTTADSLFREAEVDLRKAIESDGTRCRAYSRLTSIYRLWGRLSEAKLDAEKAFAEDPFFRCGAQVLYNLCWASLERREWGEVTRWCGEGSTEFPDEPAFPSAELTALASPDPEAPSPDPDRAWALVQHCLRLSPPHLRSIREPPAILQVAATLARAGLTDSARVVLDRALTLPGATGPRVDVQEANARLQLGDESLALDALERYLEVTPADRASTATDWWWEKLHGHPRFLRLVETVDPGTSPRHPPFD